MKTISNVLIIIFSLAFLSVQCEKEMDLNDIVEIPDDELLNYLIEDGADLNGDGLISYGEAEKITTIYLDHCGSISSVEGIEAFINLDTLHCCFNPIKDLDLSGNTELRVLVYWNSEDNDQLERLNISKNKKLEQISISRSQLTYLDVSNNLKLNSLSCDGSQLTSLDVSKNLALERLWVDINQLTNLDLSNNKALQDLSCGYNLLTNLDVSNCTKLRNLHCYENRLTQLDISENRAITSLSCGGNELSSLDISENTELRDIHLGDMPTLHEVCVWTAPFPPYWVRVNTTGSPNVNFTKECSK